MVDGQYRDRINPDRQWTGYDEYIKSVKKLEDHTLLAVYLSNMDNSKDTGGWRRSMESGMKQMNAKLDAMRHDFQTLKQTIEKSSNISHFLENQIHMEMSDTASTVSVGSSGSADERVQTNVFKSHCMKDAFQSMFIDVVRDVPLDGVIDQVLAEKIVTIPENQHARNFPHKDDGMRYLLTTVMRKDYGTMIKFVQLIGQCDEDLNKSIMAIYRERYEERQTLAKFCTACLIMERVSIKHVCDQFFTKGLIGFDLQREVTALTSAKANTNLWQRMFTELSSKPTEYVLNILKHALENDEGEESSQYADIVNSISRDIQKHRKAFKCRCEKSRKRPHTSANSITVESATETPMKRAFVKPGPSKSTYNYSHGSKRTDATERSQKNKLLKNE